MKIKNQLQQAARGEMETRRREAEAWLSKAARALTHICGKFPVEYGAGLSTLEADKSYMIAFTGAEMRELIELRRVLS